MHMKTGPYSIGYNGHAKSCDCGPCAQSRARALMRRARRIELRPPADRNQAIFVRPHFRRGKYLTKTPNTLDAYRKLLAREFKL